MGFEPDPLRSGVHVELATAQEPDEGHPKLPSHVHRQAARRGDGAHDGHPGHETLLHYLVAATSAHHDYVVSQRQTSFQERPADELVGGVVTADVLPEDRKSTRLNSSHANISYAVFCLKKKKKTPLWNFSN